MKNKKQKLNSVLLLILITMFFTSCNNDGTGDTTRTDTTGNVRESREEDFVTDVLDMNAKEIAWLNAGISKGTDAELKAEAKKMLTDHEKLRKELRDYAQKNNIMLTDMDTTNIIDINYKPGIDWDEEWADEVNDDHKRLVNRFERAERRIKEDAALKNIISSTLPVLESHRDAAKKLEDRLEKR
jgi:putative membrane protein